MENIIGVDIDGVLTYEGDDENNIWTTKISEYLGRSIKREKDVFDFMEAYNLTHDEINGFIKNHVQEVYESIQPASEARITLTNLIENNFKIILITARRPMFKKLTENWLEKHGILYTELYHESDKAPLAEELNIQLFIEDNQDNAVALLDRNIPVIMVNKYHNQSLGNPENLYRVNHWQEIQQLILNFFPKLSKDTISYKFSQD